MIETAEVVRARFLEAASTAGKLPAGPRHTASGFWPAFAATFEDMAGWGTKRLAEEREMRMQRTPPSSAAISRHDEVARWTSEFIRDEQLRKIIWTWAICHVSETSFAGHCRKQGWVRGTAHRRIRAAIELIVAALCKSNTLLRLPDELWVRHVTGNSATSFDTIGTGADAPPISPTFEILDGDRPGDTLTSPQAIENFEKHLTSVNQERRLNRERRKRKLLGLVDEPV